MPKLPLHWFAFLVPPQKEYLAARVLERRFGAQTYVPTETRWRRKNKHCKAKVEIGFAVAPRYVLAGFGSMPAWLDVLTSPGVSDVIRLDGGPKRLDETTAIIGPMGTPVRLRDEMLARFMRQVPNGRLDVVTGAIETQAHAPLSEQWMRTHREFAPGDEVDITDGPFRDRRVVVKSVHGSMARFDMPMFGERREIEVPVLHLENAA